MFWDLYTPLPSSSTLYPLLWKRVAGILIPKSKYSIITTYINLLNNINTMYINPIITIITTYITYITATTTISYSIIAMIIFVNRTRRKLKTSQSTTATWVMGGRVDGQITLYTFLVNIKSYSTIDRGRVASLLRPISTSNIVTISVN